MMRLAVIAGVLLAASLAPAKADVRVFKSDNPFGTDLFWNLREVAGFRKEFCTGASGLALISFRADVKIRTAATGVQPPIGFGFRVRHRQAATLTGLSSASWQPVPNAYSAGNVSSTDDHYGEAIIPSVPYELSTGCHRFEVWGTSHTSNAVGFDGAAELNAASGSDYNNLTIVFFEGVSLE